MAESFIIYKSFHEALKELTREQYGNVMYAINEYALYDIEPEGLSGIESAIFIMAKPQIDANKNRQQNAFKGGRPNKKPMVSESAETEKPMVFEKAETEKPNVNVNDNVNHNENVNLNVNEVDMPAKPDAPPQETKPKIQRFIKPTVLEISEYCRERNNHLDAQHFFDFYESKGWKVGNQPMKDWKAAIRNWESREKSQYPPQQSYTQNASYLPPGRLTL